MRGCDGEERVDRASWPRFGIIAVDLGFVTGEDVKEALAQQVECQLNNRRPKPIGVLFLEKGLIDKDQVHAVLEEIGKYTCAGEIVPEAEKGMR